MQPAYERTYIEQRTHKTRQHFRHQINFNSLPSSQPIKRNKNILPLEPQISFVRIIYVVITTNFIVTVNRVIYYSFRHQLNNFSNLHRLFKVFSSHNESFAQFTSTISYIEMRLNIMYLELRYGEIAPYFQFDFAFLLFKKLP